MNTTVPRIAIVVAVSRNGVIGRAGGIPWRLPSDLKRFRAITMGKPIIMGRKTWESLPRKPLPGRLNIVVSRNSQYRAPGAELATSLAAALDKAGSLRPEEIAVIGGADIYRAVLPLVTRIYLTEVDCEVDGDTFMPALDWREWRTVSVETHERGPNDAASFTLKVLDRVAPGERNDD
jgi:dihydrofolate reductase